MATSNKMFRIPVNSTQFRRSVQNVVNFGLVLPKHVVDRGVDWYPAVHDAAVQGGKDLQIPTNKGANRTENAAAIIAAVSPNMDFEKRNIHALNEIDLLDKSDWKLIERSAAQPRVPNRSGKGTHMATRLPETSAMLSEKVPGLSGAQDQYLLQARSIRQGTPWKEVVNRITSPKRYSFTINIADPSNPHEVTIDGRAADIAANRYRAWDAKRGIDRLNQIAPSGYTNYQEVYRRATPILINEHPALRGRNDIVASTIQAITWEGGKEHEKAWPTVAGTPRGKGPARTGQKYSYRHSGLWLPE